MNNYVPVGLHPTQHAQVKALAAWHERSAAAEVRVAVEEYLRREMPRYRRAHGDPPKEGT